METSDTSPAGRYRAWIDDTARRLRADAPPSGAAEAKQRARAIRASMRRAEGAALLSPREQASLDSEVLGTLERDGYRVERLVFQTRPGVYATANTYVPTRGRGPFPAVLCVHGHWAGARRDPVVQSRCIGLAKLGFFVLTLDAWGAGERGTRAGQNEYHGGLLGASLWPAGTPLHGLQLQDNLRALDYLQSRPEVDGRRIGCTGASGGGNQTTYLSAFDERVRCAVPVCSVGTFQSYLRTACCVDEVLLGGLRFAEEGDLLGMVAPGALMVVTASRDAYHFGPHEAGQALERARAYFRARGAEERVRHVVFDSGHDYSRPMREAMYGWMTRWLKEEGDGSPIPEPEIRLEEPEALRCYGPERRPETVRTTVGWVRERTRALSATADLPEGVSAWKRERERRLRKLRSLLAMPEPPGGAPWHAVPSPTAPARGFLAETEPGLRVPLELSPEAQAADRKPLVVLFHPGGRRAAHDTALARELHRAGMATLALEPRGCGDLALPGQALGEAIPDHNLVEWSLWIGRPLLGQWTHDLLQVVTEEQARFQSPARPVVLVGWRELGLAALLASALLPRARGVVAVELAATFLTETPPHNVRMALFQPGLLQVGDLPHLAALSAPRPALLAGLVRLDGMSATDEDLEALYRPSRALYRSLGHPERFAARRDWDAREVAETVSSWMGGKPSSRE